MEQVFGKLTEIRMSARYLARSEGLGTRRFPALAALVAAVREQFGGDPWLMAQAQRIIYAEARELLVHGRTPRAPAPSWSADPVTSRCWQMLRGRESACCPRCLRPLTAEQLARWEDLERARWAGLRARENAPQKEAEACRAAEIRNGA